jgi:hypothetical protein
LDGIASPEIAPAAVLGGGDTAESCFFDNLLPLTHL